MSQDRVFGPSGNYPPTEEVNQILTAVYNDAKRALNVTGSSVSVVVNKRFLAAVVDRGERKLLAVEYKYDRSIAEVQFI